MTALLTLFDLQAFAQSAPAGAFSPTAATDISEDSGPPASPEIAADVPSDIEGGASIAADILHEIGRSVAADIDPIEPKIEAGASVAADLSSTGPSLAADMPAHGPSVMADIRDL